MIKIKNRAFEPVSIAVFPFGFVSVLFIGGLFAAFNSTHSWGIVTPIVFFGFFVWFDYFLPRIARIARIRTEGFGVRYGLLMAPGYFVGELIGASMIEQVGVLDWFAGRWNSGYALFGTGSFAVKGWVWAGLYGVRVVVVFYLFAGMMMKEGGRTFCASCKRSAIRMRWKVVAGNFELDELERVESMGGLMEIVPAPRGLEGVRAVRLQVRACKCNRVAELRVDVYDRGSDMAGKQIIDNVRVSLTELLDLYDWLERVDPGAELPGVALDKVEDFEIESVEHEVFDLPMKPEGSEWKALYRLDGSGIAMEWRCDTEFTRALRKRVEVGDYLVIPEALRMASNVNDIACIYEAAADWSKAKDWMGLWCSKEPESSQAHTVRGINLVKLAWIKRGAGSTPKNYFEFQEILVEAMEAFNRATEIDDTNAVAHGWKIYAGKGLQQQTQQVRAYFDCATKKNPDLHAAHWMYYDYITPKWGGSEEECVAFARERMEACPVGSASISVIGCAHFEIACEWRQRDKKNGFENYLAQPEVRSDIFDGNQKAFRDHRMSMVTPRVRAFFAYMLWYTGHVREARIHMEIIGKSTPWDPFAPPVLFLAKDTYRAARKSCGF